MGSGFNCNLDITRSFHQITMRMEGGTPLRGETLLFGGGGGGELRLGRGKRHLGRRGSQFLPPSAPPLCINTAVSALLDEASCDVHVNTPACKKQKKSPRHKWLTA